MSQTQAKASQPPRLRAAARVLGRVLVLTALASAVLWALQRSSGIDAASAQPAGFGRGIQHGALMPLALPPLLLGRDVPIYALHNSGRSYRLGYTLGVNGCGALFFGISFWRLQRWRNRPR